MLKNVASKLHLWLGLICGSVVVVSMFAAAIFVWDEELTNWYYHDYVFVPPGLKALPLSQLLDSAQSVAGPTRLITDVAIVHESNKSYVFTTYADCSNCMGWTHWSNYKYWYHIYVNPYTGKAIGKVDMLHNWIDLTRRLHQNLLLKYEVGHYIVGYSTLIIFVMILTGLILWFPKNKAAFKQRFTIKWNARWRRVNYDIHNVGGFYTWMVIFILAITGPAWTFEWWTNGIYRLLGNDSADVYVTHAAPIPSINPTPVLALDIAFTDVLTKRQHWENIYAGLPTPHAENDGEEFAFYVRYDENKAWEETDRYYYNAQTGLPQYAIRFEDQPLGEKWRNSNYAIHIGAIYGLPTKIIACFGALFLSSLPVTGFLIYLGRKNKKPKASATGRHPKRKTAAVLQHTTKQHV